MKVKGVNSETNEEYQANAEKIDDAFLNYISESSVSDEAIKKLLEKLPVSADAKSLLFSFAKAAIQIGERIVKIGKKILSLIFTMCKEYPSTTFGAIFGATVGLLISSIPVLGFILGPIALPLLIIVGIGVGAIEDIKDKMLARKIKEINAEFSPLNA